MLKRRSNELPGNRERGCGPAFFASLVVVLFLSESSLAASLDDNLADLSLEQLGNIDVTSVSKKSERLLDAPASIYVITSEDIRRSGVTSLPEALRLAPNLQVARTNSSQYGISARGFNNAGNKLLVLIDGRIVYTPLYSGVIWYDQDVMLEDVERIEVISGPGGTLWGSNAVNGVINVITRPAGSTQGGLVSAGLGNRERGAAARYGGELGGAGHFRIYAKGFDDANTNQENGAPVSDGWERAQTGFRADWGHGNEGYTLQGDAYRGRLDLAVPDDQRISGSNLLGRWTHRVGDGNQLQVQAYIDQSELDVPGSGTSGTFSERLTIADLEFQHGFTVSNNAVTWGGGYRSAHDHLVNINSLAFLPAIKDMEWSDLFLQDEIPLLSNLSFTAGTKIEKNPYTGIEFLPSIRLAWKPTEQQLVWSAVSRAVRTPSRLDRELYSPSQPPFLIAGGPDFRSEVAEVVEIGYRAQPTQSFSYSVTVFHNIYDHLRSIEFTTTGSFVIGNKMEGRSTGVEAWSTLQVTKRWRLSAGAFYLDQDLRMQADSTDATGISAAGNDPTHQFTLRSSLDLPHRTELDVDVRNVGRLPNPEVRAYTAVDMRIGWHVDSNVELSLVGTNLFDPEHAEFGTLGVRSEIGRAVYGKVLWRF